MMKTLHYRNAIFQGQIDPYLQLRDGFGLIYGTNSHALMASQWKHDQANNYTLIFHSHQHYMYGVWLNNLPHGLNVIRVASSLFYINYEHGRIVGNFIAVFEKYNLALVITPIQRQTDIQFEVFERGQLYSDEDFNNYVRMCGWESFDPSYKTIIRFIDRHLTQEGNQNIRKVKLRLINESYFKFGFDEGVAMVFDDEYRVSSAGLHKKAKLQSIGIKYKNDRYAEEGNFGDQAQVYVFDLEHRPTSKINKLYSQFLLKSVNFVNRFVSDPSEPFTSYFKVLLNQQFFKQILSGQITTRRIEVDIEASRKAHSRPHSPTSQYPPNYDDEEAKKIKLQMYKKQIQTLISKKKQPPAEPQKSQTERLPVKEPVGRIAKVKEYKKQYEVTPERDHPTCSPFKQKMNQRFLQTKKKTTRKMEQIENIKEFQSPHEDFECSHQQNQSQSSHIPLSLRQNQKTKSTKKYEVIERKQSPKKVRFVQSKNSYSQRYKQKKSRSPFDSKNQEKYSQIVKKFNESKNAPGFKDKRISPQRKYEYYFD